MYNQNNNTKRNRLICQYYKSWKLIFTYNSCYLNNKENEEKKVRWVKQFFLNITDTLS